MPSDLIGWLFPRDPRRLALLFAAVLLVCLVGGGALAVLLRGELYNPERDLISADAFDHVFALHGLLLGFLFMLPAIPTTLGHLVVPRQLGVDRLPWISAAGLPLLVASVALVVVSSLAAPTFPGAEQPFGLTLGLAGLLLSAVLTALGLVVTALGHNKRGAAMPLFAWSIILGALATLLSATLIVAVGLSNPERANRLLGAALVTVTSLALIPAFGIVCELLEANARGLAARRLVLAALTTLAVVAVPVWALIPAGYLVVQQIGRVAVLVLLCTWALPLARHARHAPAPLLYALAAVVTLLLAGLAGAVFTASANSLPFFDSYFAVGHFHLRAYVVLLALLGGLHHWWHDLTGRHYHAPSARLGAALVWSGTTLHAITALALGQRGLPRHYYGYLPEFTGLHRLATIAAVLTAVGVLWVAATLARSTADGRAA